MSIYGNIGVHNVKSVSLDQIRELERDDGTRFFSRCMTVVALDAKGEERELTFDLYSAEFDAIEVSV